MNTRGFPGAPEAQTNPIRPLAGSRTPPQKTMDERMQRRADAIKTKFLELDPDPINPRQLTFPDIQAFLNNKAQENGRNLFDDNLLLELFAITQKGRESIITVDEFIYAYVYAESKIEDNIQQKKQEIGKHTSEQEHLERRLIEERTNESFNPNGVSTNSLFTIHVHEADSLPMTGEFQVRLRMDNQEIFTQKAIVHQGNLLTWADNFTFKITTGKEILEIDVIDAEVGPSAMGDSAGVFHDEIKRVNQVLGKASVSVEDFRAQSKQRKDIMLEEGSGRISLEFLWIWSMQKYLEDIIKTYKSTVDSTKFYLDSLEKQQVLLETPFPRPKAEFSMFDNKGLIVLPAPVQ